MAYIYFLYSVYIHLLTVNETIINDTVPNSHVIITYFGLDSQRFPFFFTGQNNDYSVCWIIVVNIFFKFSGISSILDINIFSLVLV